VAMPHNRDSEGRFLPGASGNPGGRPRKLAELDPVLDEHRSPENVRAVLAKLRELALAGDIQAMRLYLDKVFPTLKRLEDEIDLTGAPDAVLQWLGGK